MQAQATGSRRYGFNRMMMLALAIGILAISAVLVATNIEFGADTPANTLVAHPAPLQGEGLVDPANSVAAASDRLPVIRYTAPYAGDGLVEMGFLEWNTLPAGDMAEPAQSVEQIRFLEQNIWEYAPGSAEYQGLDAHPAPNAGQDYKFLEENLFGIGPEAMAPENRGLQPSFPPAGEGRIEWGFLEQNIWDVVPADTSPEQVGIHRDEGINEGLGY